VCRPTLGDSIFASNDQSYAPATALGSLSNGQSGQGHCVTANDQGTGTAPNSSMLLMYRRHNSPTHYIKVIIHLLSSLSDGQSGQGHCVTANDQGTGTARNSSIAITHQLTTSKSSPNPKALCPMDRVDKDIATANHAVQRSRRRQTGIASSQPCALQSRGARPACSRGSGCGSESERDR
jgi:hypothetical protein